MTEILTSRVYARRRWYKLYSNTPVDHDRRGRLRLQLLQLLTWGSVVQKVERRQKKERKSMGIDNTSSEVSIVCGGTSHYCCCRN